MSQTPAEQETPGVSGTETPKKQETPGVAPGAGTAGVDASEGEEDEEEPDVEPYNPDTWTPSFQRVHRLRPRKGR
jgi:hypothetical protein